MTDGDFERFLGNALKLWSEGSEKSSQPILKQAVDFMHTAVRVYGKPSSKLQGLMALMEYELTVVCANSGDRNLIRMSNTHAQEAHTAAQQAVQISNGLELRGYLVLMYLKADQLLVMDPDLSRLNPMGSGGILGALFGAINTGVDAVRVRNSHKEFEESMQALLAAFTKLFSEYVVEVEEFLFIAERLLAAIPMLDQLRKVAMKKDIYDAVLRVDLSTLTYEGMNEQEALQAKTEAQHLRDTARAGRGL